MKHIKIDVTLKGIRDLMFDKYCGSNDANPLPEEKLYLDDNDQLVVPTANLLSMLSAENTKSVSKVYYDARKGTAIRHAIKTFLTFSDLNIVISDENGPLVFNGWNDKIYLRKDIARLKGGVPHVKLRPVIVLPWYLNFELTIIGHPQNKILTERFLHELFQYGGLIGIGTHRPEFGQFMVDNWDSREVTV